MQPREFDRPFWEASPCGLGVKAGCPRDGHGGATTSERVFCKAGGVNPVPVHPPDARHLPWVARSHRGVVPRQSRHPHDRLRLRMLGEGVVGLLVQDLEAHVLGQDRSAGSATALAATSCQRERRAGSALRRLLGLRDRLHRALGAGLANVTLSLRPSESRLTSGIAGQQHERCRSSPR